MKKSLYLIAFALTLQSCPGQDKEDPKVALPKEYEACCGVQPVNFKMDNESIYVPNAFTPNGDGINDLFYPVISQNIVEAQGFRIFSAEGDTLLFYRMTTAYERVDQYAWDGRRSDGTVYRGKFKYWKLVSGKEKNRARLVEGEACSILCEPGTKDLKVKKTCFYPSQAGKSDKLGKLDDKLVSNEKDCIK